MELTEFEEIIADALLAKKFREKGIGKLKFKLILDEILHDILPLKKEEYVLHFLESKLEQNEEQESIVVAIFQLENKLLNEKVIKPVTLGVIPKFITLD